MQGALLKGMGLGFSRELSSTISVGPDVGISPHAVDQHSDWLTTEAVECHIKLSG